MTVAVNTCMAPDCNGAGLGGAMETVIPGIVMFADPVAAPLVTEAAVTATTKLPAGGLAGAV